MGELPTKLFKPIIQMKPCRIIHLPDFHQANPYQSLLLKSLTNLGFDVGCGTRKVYFSFIDLSILFSLVKNRGVDIIHLHWLHPFLLHGNKTKMMFRGFIFVLQLLLIRILGKKIVWTVHNMKNHENRFAGIEIFFSRIVSALANAVIAHCEASKEEITEFFRIRRNKIFVIPHGHYVKVYRETRTRQECREGLNLQDSDFVFLFLGLIRPYKGILEMIESFQEIDNLSAKLIIAGRVQGSDLFDVIEKKTALSKNILSELRYIPDDDLEIYLKAADVMVLPYRDIVNSGSAVLGMSFGKVIIAPHLGCIPEILNSGGGILYNPNDKNGLLKAMKSAMASKAKFIEMGEHNYQLAIKMDWKDIAASTGKVYVECRGK